MGFSLESIGMKEGGRYESIFTTMNQNEEMDAAPIGVKCIGDEEIAARIFEGSTTLENIKETKVFCVNITDNPMLYAQTLFKTYDDSQLKKDDDIFFLKDADAYGIALVTSIDEQTLENDQISTEGKAFVVKAEVLKIVVNRQGAKAINRGLFAFLECLVNYSRIDLIDDEAKGKYVDRFLENESLIERVGSEDIKESMSLLKDKMIEKGIEF
jgi:hypothetical protein